MPIPSPQSETTILDFLKALGLSEDEAHIYLTLSKNGPLTNLQLSREASIPRTNVYRYLEHMKHQGLVEDATISDTNQRKTKKSVKQKSQATPPDRLEKILHERESQLRFLNQKFPLVAHHLDKVHEEISSQNNGQPTKTLFFRGKQGVKQMFWNTLQAKKEILTFSHHPVKEYVGKSLIKDYWQELRNKKIHVKNLFSTEHGALFKSPSTLQRKSYSTHLVSPDTLDIEMQIFIYNNIVAFFNWHEGEVFGTEIHNEKIAGFNRQMFEVMWEMERD